MARLSDCKKYSKISIDTFTACPIHYANTPMQYTAIFHGCKNVNFQMKNYNIYFSFFALKY